MYSLLIPLLFGAAQAVLVPPPYGPYSVAVKQMELIDEGRIDQLAPNNDTKRRFMASAFLPIDAAYGCNGDEVVPYMPNLTATVFGKAGEALGLPADFIGEFQIEFCDIYSIDRECSVQEKEFPIVVFSPGFQGTRFMYAALARSLASLGYIVINVDHTYETFVVEFPDGTAEYAPEGLQLDNKTMPAMLEVGTSQGDLHSTEIS